MQSGADRDTKCREEIANIFGGNVCPFKIIELSVLKDLSNQFSLKSVIYHWMAKKVFV